MADKIRIADLLASNLAIDWFESVSLVREVCAVLIAERVQNSTPDLGQILLGPSGRITISGTAHGDAPVGRLGQLLQALLQTTEPPVTLRLVLSEATASPPVYASVTELDAALAYFERPDRGVVLRALYERAAKADLSASGVASIQELDSVAPTAPPPAAETPRVPHVEPAKKKRQSKPSSRRELVLVVGTVLLIVVGAVAYGRGMILHGKSSRGTTAVDKAVVATMSAVSELAGMGKLIEPGATSEIPTPAAPEAAGPRKRSSRATPVTLAGVPVRLFDLQPTQDVEPAIDSPASVPPAVLEASANPETEADTRVYGPDDQAVAAPLAIRPHLPTVLPTGVVSSDLARIELVVASDGLVESVKLVPGKGPVSVTEAMLLSAAKAWRFTPATKAGEPVRYRKTVFLSEK